MIGHSRTSVLRWLYFCIVALAGMTLAAAQSCPIPTAPYARSSDLRYLMCGPSQYATHPVARCNAGSWVTVGMSSVAPSICTDFAPNTMTVSMDSDNDYIAVGLAENFTLTAPVGHTIRIELIESTAASPHSFTAKDGCQFFPYVTVAGSKQAGEVSLNTLESVIPEVDAAATTGTINFGLYCPELALSAANTLKIRAVLVKPDAAQLSAPEANHAVYTVLSHGFQLAKLLIFDDASNIETLTNTGAAVYGYRHAPSAESVMSNADHSFMIATVDATASNIATICPGGFSLSSSAGNCFAQTTIAAPTSPTRYVPVGLRCNFNFTLGTPSVTTTLSIKCLSAPNTEVQGWRVALPQVTTVVRRLACDTSVFSAAYSYIDIADPVIAPVALGVEVTPLSATTARVSCAQVGADSFAVFGADTVTCNESTNQWSQTKFRCIQTVAANMALAAGACPALIASLLPAGMTDRYEIEKTNHFSGAQSYRVSCSSSAYAISDFKSLDALCYTDASGTAKILMLDDVDDVKGLECISATCNAASLSSLFRLSTSKDTPSGLGRRGDTATLTCDRNEYPGPTNPSIECRIPVPAVDAAAWYVLGSNTLFSSVSASYTCAANTCLVNYDGTLNVTGVEAPVMPTRIPTRVVVGSSMTIPCPDGEHSKARIVCQTGGTWAPSTSVDELKCVPSFCPASLLAGGPNTKPMPEAVKESGIAVGTEFAFECEPGFRSAGARRCEYTDALHTGVGLVTIGTPSDGCDPVSLGSECLITPKLDFRSHHFDFKVTDEDDMRDMLWTEDSQCRYVPPVVLATTQLTPTYNNTNEPNKLDRWIWEAPFGAVVDFACPAGTRSAVLLNGDDSYIFIESSALYNVSCGASSLWKYDGKDVVSMTCMAIQCPAISRLLQRYTEVRRIDESDSDSLALSEAITRSWDLSAASMTTPQPLGTIMQVACRSGFAPSLAGLTCSHGQADAAFSDEEFTKQPLQPTWTFNLGAGETAPGDLDETILALTSMCGEGHCMLDQFKDDNLEAVFTATMLAGADHARAFKGVVAAGADVEVTCPAFSYPTVPRMTCVNSGVGFVEAGTINRVAPGNLCAGTCGAYTAGALPADTVDKLVWTYFSTYTATNKVVIVDAPTRKYVAENELPVAIEVTCEPGFALFEGATAVAGGTFEIACSASSWDPAAALGCKPLFCEPPVIEGVTVTLAKDHSANVFATADPNVKPSEAAVWTATCPDHMAFSGTHAPVDDVKSVQLTCASGAEYGWTVTNGALTTAVSKFSDAELRCVYVTCPLPGSIDAGAYTLQAATGSANMVVIIESDGTSAHNEFEIDGTVQVTCAPGFGMVGQSAAMNTVTLTCKGQNGRFELAKPLPAGAACVAITCPNTIASLAPATLPFNLPASITADALPAALTAHGSLIGLAECPAPVDADAVPLVVANPYNVKCERHYDATTGLLSAIGQWVKVKIDIPSFESPLCVDCAPVADVETRCVPSECAIPASTPAYSFTALTNVDKELVARVTCAPGYTRVRTIPEFVECFRGAWSADLTGDICVATSTASVACAPAEFTAAGVRVKASGSVGTVVSAECIADGAYFVNNTLLVECSAAGVWGPAHSVIGANVASFPECRVQTCFALDKLRTLGDDTIVFSDVQTAVYQNGAQSVLHDMTEYPSGTVANVVCKQGYVLEGAGRYTCDAGSWTGVGSCVPKLHVKEARLENGGKIFVDFLGSTAKLEFSAIARANGVAMATEHTFVGALDCDTLFPAASYQFGTGATCVFEPHRIVVTLGTSFGLRGHPIALNGERIVSAEVDGMRLAKLNADSLVYVPLVDATNSLQAVYAASAETATTCGGWELDASSSTGAIGLSLAYGFELVDGTPKQIYDFAMLVKAQAPVVNANFAGGRSNQPVSKIVFTAAQVKDIFDLTAAGTNTVRVSVSNWAGSVSTADIIVVVQDNNLPSLRLSEPAVTMYESQTVTITASATSSPCSATNSQVSLTWVYNGAVVARGSSLTIAPAALGLQVGDDQIQVIASQLGAVTATRDVIVWLPITVLAAAPTIVINGVKCPAAGCTADLFYDGLAAPFTLDASKSFDPAFLPEGAAGLTFVWTCTATRSGVTAACGDFNLDGVYSTAAAQLSVSAADLAALGDGIVTFTATVSKGAAVSTARYIATLAASGSGFVSGFSTVTGFAAPTVSSIGVAFVNTANAPLQIVANVAVGADSTFSSEWACPGVLAAPITGVSALQLSAEQLAAATVPEFTCTAAFSFTDAASNVVTAPVQRIRILINKAPATPVCASVLRGDEYTIVCSTNKPAEEGQFKFEQSIRGAMTTVAVNPQGEYVAALGAGSHRFQITFTDKYGAAASASYAIAGQASANSAGRLAEAVHAQDAVAMAQSITASTVALAASNDAVNATKTRKDLFNSLNSNLAAFYRFDAQSQASIQGSSTAIGVLASIADATQSDAELRKSTLTLARSLAAGLSKSVGVSAAAAEALHSIADDAIRAAAVQGDNVENIAVLKAFNELAEQIAFSSKTAGKSSADFASAASTVKYARVSTAAASTAFANGDITVSADLFAALAAAGHTHVDAVLTTITAPQFIANIGGSAGSDSASSIASLSFYTVDGTPVDTSAISAVYVTLKHEAALRGALHNERTCQFFKTSATEDAAKATEATTWSSAGCTVASSTETQTVCKCTHLTLFRAVAGSGVYETVDWLPLNRSNLDDNRTPIFMIVVWIAVCIVFGVVAYLVDRSKKADAAKALVEQWTAGRSPIVAPLANDASSCDYIFKGTGLLLSDYHLLYSVFARNVLDNVSSLPRMFGAMTVYLTAFALNAMFWGGVDARTDIDNYGGVIFLAAVVMVFVSFMIKALLNSTHHAGVKKFVYRYAYELVALHELGTSDFFPKKDHAKLRASLNPAHADLYRQVLQAKASGQILELNSLLRQVVVLQESHVVETLAAQGTASNGGALVSYVVLLAWAIGMCVLICAFGIQFGQTVATTPGKWIGSSFATIAIEAFAVKPFIFFVLSLFSVYCSSSRAESLPDDKRDRALTAYALDANVIAAMGKAAATSGGYSAVAHNESAPVATHDDDMHHI